MKERKRGTEKGGKRKGCEIHSTTSAESTTLKGQIFSGSGLRVVGERGREKNRERERERERVRRVALLNEVAPCTLSSGGFSAHNLISQTCESWTLASSKHCELCSL
jgi:hypothetical protein